MTRKELSIWMSAMFSVLLLIIIGYGQKETRDISFVRAENKSQSDAIISEIRANNNDAIERSKAGVERSNHITERIDQLLGKTDTLIRELSSEGTRP